MFKSECEKKRVYVATTVSDKDRYAKKERSLALQLGVSHADNTRQNM